MEDIRGLENRLVITSRTETQIDGKLRQWCPREICLVVARPLSLSNLLAVGFNDEDRSLKVGDELDAGQKTIFGVGGVG